MSRDIRCNATPAAKGERDDQNDHRERTTQHDVERGHLKSRGVRGGDMRRTRAVVSSSRAARGPRAVGMTANRWNDDVPPWNDDVPPWNGGVPPWNGDVPPWNDGVPPWNGDVPPWNGDVPPWNGDVPPWNDGTNKSIGGVIPWNGLAIPRRDAVNKPIHPMNKAIDRAISRNDASIPITGNGG